MNDEQIEIRKTQGNPRRLGSIYPLIGLLLCTACAEKAEQAQERAAEAHVLTVRLIDEFKPEMISDSAPKGNVPGRTEWIFDTKPEGDDRTILQIL